MAENDRDDDSFIYQRYKTLPGVKLETVTGCLSRSGRVWNLLARQIWSENARDGGYRQIDHTASGAPLLVEDAPGAERQRISVSHTDGILAVATLPPAQDTDIESFDTATALGVDVERSGRDQVLRVRERFLNERELDMVPSDSIAANITAWTCKEAMLKLALDTSLDIRRNLLITRPPLPQTDKSSDKRSPRGEHISEGEHIKCLPTGEDMECYSQGEGNVILADGTTLPVLLHTMALSSGHILTIAYTPHTTRYSSPSAK